MHDIKTNFDKILEVLKSKLKNKVDTTGNFPKVGKKPKSSDLKVIRTCSFPFQQHTIIIPKICHSLFCRNLCHSMANLLRNIENAGFKLIQITPNLISLSAKLRVCYVTI